MTAIRPLATGAALTLTVAAAAQADAPLWEGYWAHNVAHCAQTGSAGDGTPDWYGRDGLFGVEWSCDIDKTQPSLLPNAWSLSLSCIDAGYEYKENQIFLITPDDRLLILTETGPTANMVRCQGDKK